MESDDPLFRWRMLTPSGVTQTFHQRRRRLDDWQQVLFSRGKGAQPALLILKHTDPNSRNLFKPRLNPRVRDAGAGKPKRRP